MSNPIPYDSKAQPAYDFDTVIDRRGTGSAKWNRYPGDVLPMWVADMDLPVAPEIMAAIARRAAHPVMGYGVTSAELRETLAAEMMTRYGWEVSPEAITLLPSVTPGFSMPLKAFSALGKKGGAGKGVLVQTPMYPPILAAAGHWNLERHDVPMVDGGARWEIDLDAFGKAAGKSAAFILCNPHNPTGRVFGREELLAMAEKCLAAGTLIIADEVHCDLLYDGRRHVPMASLSPEIAERTITIMAASKTYNIAGLKTAFAIIPNAELRREFEASRMGLVDSVNVIGLDATLAAYRHGGPWHKALIPYLQANRDYLVDAVKTRLPGISLKTPEATFLAWLDCSALGLADAYAHFLEKGKVGFNPGADFADKRFVRLNFGCSRKTLEEGIRRMETALA
ncbi:MalY/PatB family protein [Radicibacter daui]|uniref:MalY/PatB family protein n=1 Tax=Radicibacter daui TaxID=3064829 RepID=UPI0040468D93